MHPGSAGHGFPISGGRREQSEEARRNKRNAPASRRAGRGGPGQSHRPAQIEADAPDARTSFILKPAGQVNWPHGWPWPRQRPRGAGGAGTHRGIQFVSCPGIYAGKCDAPTRHGRKLGGWYRGGGGGGGGGGMSAGWRCATPA
ncbi:translation initiation factor IF-2-like [Schistocerca cancellata]|uniref:translation initiation factor IF-2-like n=1 Tax=Schistocerca cancellata TaxID=274614 RepID=UPI0021199B38|nr:translation initiation factor IF-2-like [Schistocerca cancellata]